MSRSPSFFETIGELTSDLTAAFQPIAESMTEAARQISDAFEEAFAPLLARKRPYETGKELAELAVDERLTVAERYPVRAETEYDADAIVVSYDDGTGFEGFVTYSKDALAGGRDE